jgi:DHA1 family bicyclomycin/chloramphenicol resistance-like MFS transporter
MNAPAPQRPIGFAEFVLLMALCTSLVALSIDAMLPALPDIGQSFGIQRANTQQFIITLLFAGLAVGQMIAGPLSDNIGRKKAIYIGLVIFIIGSLLSYFAPSFEIMLLGRFIQGLGAAAPRVVTIAMVRDQYEGRDMARVMSYIMGVFILVPAIAPSIGQAIIALSGWHAIFLVFIGMALVCFIWFSLRQPETLHNEDKRPFTFAAIYSGLKTVLGTRMTVCYMVSSGLVFGAFLGYLNSAQQIFQGYYDVGTWFPIYFGMIALALGAAFFVNGQLVQKYGMRFIAWWSLVVMSGFAVLFSGFEFALQGHIPLAAFITYIMASAFCLGLLFGNFNALAMVPMGHIAGLASAVIGSVSLVISMIAGAVIGQLYDGSLIPMTVGFLTLSLLSLLMMRLAEKKP